MQEEKNNASNDELASEKPSFSIGKLLVDARNHAALNQADIAEQINLPVEKIKALENDDYDNLPESTYVRGYIRSYARLVGLDAEELVKAYFEHHHTETQVARSTNAKPSYDSAFLWSTAAVLTILVGLLITWWVDKENSPEPEVQVASTKNVQSITVNETVKEEPAITTEKLESEAQEVVEAEPVSTPDTKLPVEEQASSSESIEYVTEEVEQAMEKESQDPTLVSMSHEFDVLTVTFVEKSWTEIHDADANTLMQGLIEPGVVKNLNGKSPFQIFLGNSPGVVIEVNGQYFDQSEFNRSNRTARVQVSGSSFN